MLVCVCVCVCVFVCVIAIYSIVLPLYDSSIILPNKQTNKQTSINVHCTGYSVTDVAKLLDGGKLLHLSDGAFRKMKTLTRRWMDR